MEYKFIITVVIIIILIIVWKVMYQKTKLDSKIIGKWNKLSAGFSDVDSISSIYSLEISDKTIVHPHMINNSELCSNPFKITQGHIDIKLSEFSPLDYWEILIYEYPSLKCISVLSRPTSIKITHHNYITVFLKIWRQKEILNKPAFKSKVRLKFLSQYGNDQNNSTQGNIFSGGDISLCNDIDALEEIVCSKMSSTEGSIFYAEKLHLNAIDSFFSSPYSYTYCCEKNIKSTIIAIICPVRTKTLGVIHHSFVVDFGVKRFVWYPSSASDIGENIKNRLLNNVAYILIPVPRDCNHVSIIERIAPLDNNQEVLPSRFYS